MWFSRRALVLHAVIVVIVPTFIAMCVWQLQRALGGNDLSWAYVFEWPFFAGYAVYMWWRFVHEAGDAPAPPAPQSPTASEEAELAAYNDYLAELAERDKPTNR
ncbi:MAG TPA: hypothetical protein VND70_05115 [Acidimicrobiales bacterium]|nr:hypothetical protein [Acidimicrobiales bacterium]